MEIKECEVVTRAMVRTIKTGTFVLFQLPNGAKVLSATSTIRQVEIMNGRKFSVCQYKEDSRENCIKVTRLV